MSNIPVTFFGGNLGDGLELYIGKTTYFERALDDAFQFTVIDLTNPTGPALVNESSNSDSTVPAAVAAYLGKPNTMLCFGFNTVYAISIPTGDLYDFLIKVGADAKLRQIEQIVEQSGSNYVESPGYLLIASMDSAGSPGFEESSLKASPVLTLELVPNQIGGQTVCSPAELS